MIFFGRKQELAQIHERLADVTKAQMFIVYGRRRVGKSTLIKKSLTQEQHVLYFEGIQGEPKSAQIDQFLNDLSQQTGRVKLAAKTWRKVFQGLEEIILQGRWILVFDELPWMACGRQQMIAELKLYWDRWASKNQNIVLFLCGSVASFMTKHLIHSKALHNRKTLEICLPPFSPKETGLFIKKRSLAEKAQLYMCLGGIPKYLEQIRPDLSLAKNLNRLCFVRNGFFVSEYETLFKEQFRSKKIYQEIVENLAQGSKNLSELAKNLKIKIGGGLKSYLENLKEAQFIREYTPYSAHGKEKTRTKIFKLTDPFLIFYFRYIAPNKSLIEKNTDEDLFQAITRGSIHSYYGFAFERFCEDSFKDILEKIGLKLADLVNVAPYFQQKTGEAKGFQIDNLLQRRDDTWTVMEYKYSQKPIGISIIEEMEQKINRLNPPENISIEVILITASGVTKNVEKSSYFHKILTLRDFLE